jgi:mono/diheme cytochrome c family protein
LKDVKRPLLLPLAAALATLAGCAAQIPPATEADALRASLRWPGTTVSELEHGRSLYLGHCSSCHSPYGPQRYATEKWRGFVQEMATRSKLGPADAEAVIRYLVAASEKTPVSEAAAPTATARPR